MKTSYKRKLLGGGLILFLFVVSFYYFLYGYQYFNLRTYHFDEAISAYGAAQMLDGKMPYRDFWTFHAPGRFCALAAAFKILGISLKATRLFAVFILSLTSCGLYLFVSKAYSRFAALLAFLLSLAGMKLHMVYNRPGQFAVLFIVFSWIPLLNYISSGKRRWLIITGIITGIIGIFRIDFVCYNFISLFLLIFLKNIDGGKEECYRKRLFSAVRDEFYLLFGIFLISLPNFLFFFFSGGFWEFKKYIISGIEQRNRYIPLPALKFNTAIFYFPALVFLLTAIKLLFCNLRDKGVIFWLKLYFLFIGVFLYGYALTRVGIPHLIPVMIPAIVLIVFFCSELMGEEGRAASFRKILKSGGALLLCFYFLFYSVNPYFGELRLISQQGDKIKLDVPRSAGFYDHSELAQSQIAAIKYIRERTKENDKIFVGNLRHDKVVNNDVMFYFLSQRDSATKYYQFEPGITTTRKIQEQIINDLIKENVGYIVLWSAAEGINEPNESNKSSGISDLDNFIQENYKSQKVFGQYAVLKRR